MRRGHSLLDRYRLADFRDTPTLDGLAARGVRFRQAIAASSYTPSSHASILTGRFPPSHGVRAFLVNPLPPGVPTLAEEMARGGFHTVSAIDFGPMFHLLGLDRGFSERFAADDAVLLEHLRETIDEPLFLFMHLGDVHPPVGESFDEPWDRYNEEAYRELVALAGELGLIFDPLPDTPAERRAAAAALSNRVRTWADDRGVTHAIELPRYLAGVNKFDRGRLAKLLRSFEEIGLLEGTLLVVLSDHGQGLIPGRAMGDNSVPAKFDHGEVVFEETIRVPLLVSGPGIREGAVLDTQVSLADIAPTIADWAGVDAPEGSEGRVLRALLEGAEQDDSLAYSEVWYHDRARLGRYLKRCLAAGRLLEEGYESLLHMRSIRTPRFKYIRRGDELVARDWELPDAEFVRQAHQKLVARAAEPAVIAELTGQLRDGVRSRRELVVDLASRDADREALYDLDSDPHESVNLLLVERSLGVLGRERELRPVADRLAEIMRTVEERRIHEAGVRTEVSDMSIIEERLRELGYVE